ncbi:MMPL family transporter [Periweissella cryptocerci]|uniref:MMPL family transporter n=1 Tax=Periweissella cryptocerci TaxID=2506420 RepID=A0A4P6YU44_9LACO|nr:MMPL family transporter [Periweissella cryptocerci]QBO36240.1 MMPL family transporter [Periweissella cryptocerci]
MQKVLKRWGSWVAQHKWPVIIIWLVMMLGLGVGFAKVGSNFNPELKISGLPSTEIQKPLEKDFGQKTSNGSLKIVIKAHDKTTLMTPKMQATVAKTVTDLQAANKSIKGVSNPYQTKVFSKDLTTTYLDVSFSKQARHYTYDQIAKLEKIAKHNLKFAKVEVEFSGNVQVSKPMAEGTSEIIGMGIAFVLMLILFRAITAAWLPILNAIIGLGAGLLIVSLGTNVFDVAKVASTLAIMIGLAVGIDYALFIINRYRVEKQHMDNYVEAIGNAVGYAGSSVLFAGVTVMIAVAGLSFVGIDFLTQMGLASAISVLFAILSALTLLPAMISLFHQQVAPKRQSHKVVKQSRIANVIVKWPAVVAIAGILILGGLAVPATHMRLGMPSDAAKPANMTERKAYDIMTDKFGAGINAQIIGVVKTTKDMQPTDLQKITSDLNQTKGVAMATPAQLSPNGKYALLMIIPTTGPTSDKTSQLVHRLRDYGTTLKDETGLRLSLTGTNVVNIDIVNKLNKAIPIFALIVIVLAFILLLIVFQSVLIPFVAMVGFGLSLLATFGFTTLVMQDGFLKNIFGIGRTAPLLAFLPVIAIGVLFGLAMDYEVFMVDRIREEYLLTGDNVKAVQVGVKESGPVIITAALIMVAVFGSFVFTADPTIKSIGLVLAFGVLFDAFIVRLSLVPAMIKLFGRLNWWLPGRSAYNGFKQK